MLNTNAPQWLHNVKNKEQIYSNWEVLKMDFPNEGKKKGHTKMKYIKNKVSICALYSGMYVGFIYQLYVNFAIDDMDRISTLCYVCMYE